MVNDRYEKERYVRELGLFLQESCCHLCRFQHVSEHDLNPWEIKINREVYLGIPGSYADMKVQVPGSASYFVEVTYGREPHIIISSLKHKYGNDSSALDGASKLILVVDAHRHKDWSEIRNTGGMLYQFVGDEVSAFYGICDNDSGYIQSAFETAKSIIDIGNWVSYQWKRHLDHVQNSKGVHIGMALGDIQIVSIRPFGRALMSAVGDTINLTARLVDKAGPNKIVISNTYYQNLDQKFQAE